MMANVLRFSGTCMLMISASGVSRSAAAPLNAGSADVFDMKCLKETILYALTEDDTGLCLLDVSAEEQSDLDTKEHTCCKKIARAAKENNRQRVSMLIRSHLAAAVKLYTGIEVPMTASRDWNSYRLCMDEEALNATEAMCLLVQTQTRFMTATVFHTRRASRLRQGVLDGDALPDWNTSAATVNQDPPKRRALAAAVPKAQSSPNCTLPPRVVTAGDRENMTTTIGTVKKKGLSRGDEAGIVIGTFVAVTFALAVYLHLKSKRSVSGSELVSVV